MESEPVEKMKVGSEPGEEEEEEDDRKRVGQVEESREGLVASTDSEFVGYWEQLEEQSGESELWE